MSQSARSADDVLDAPPSSAPARPSSMPPEGARRRRRRRRRTPSMNDARRRERNKVIAFWIFAIFAVAVVTYGGLVLNGGAPP